MEMKKIDQCYWRGDKGSQINKPPQREVAVSTSNMEILILPLLFILNGKIAFQTAKKMLIP